MVSMADIRKRLQATSGRARGGFTLVELIATMAVLLLVGSVVATGVPVAQQAYTNAVDASNAQLLLSTCATSLRDRLAVADPATIETSTPAADASEKTYVTFESMETGLLTQIKSSADQGLFVQEAPTAEASEALVSKTPLVPGKAAIGARESLVVRIEGISYDSANGVFTVRGLEVVRGDGSSLGGALVDELKVKTIAGPVGAA